jgi:hypothetical protein
LESRIGRARGREGKRERGESIAGGREGRRERGKRFGEKEGG